MVFLAKPHDRQACEEIWKIFLVWDLLMTYFYKQFKTLLINLLTWIMKTYCILNFGLFMLLFSYGPQFTRENTLRHVSELLILAFPRHLWHCGTVTSGMNLYEVVLFVLFYTYNWCLAWCDIMRIIKISFMTTCSKPLNKPLSKIQWVFTMLEYLSLCYVCFPVLWLHGSILNSNSNGK